MIISFPAADGRYYLPDDISGLQYALLHSRSHSWSSTFKSSQGYIYSNGINTIL